MGLIGGAIGAGVSAIAGIFGGRAASKAMKNIEKDLNQTRGAIAYHFKSKL